MAQQIESLLFDAQSIQGYLFDTGKLRDTVGASELVASLTGAPLDAVLQVLDPQGSLVKFSRRLGGAFYAFSARPGLLERLADYWTLLLARYAPGLHYGLGLGSGGTHLEAFDRAREALTADDNRPRTELPLAPPVAARSPRTGRAAVTVDRHHSFQDAATLSKQAHGKGGSVTARFQPDGAGLHAGNWPRDLEEKFPFCGENRTLALVHMDGNGLGQLLQNLKHACEAHPDQYITIFKAFSNGIAHATEEAAKAATAAVLLPELAARRRHHDDESMLAARPLVLGGDDVTLLIRADLALDFVRTFTETFESASADFMRELGKLGAQNLPSHLTLGTGMVYLQSSQPFHLAYQLVEGLAGAAKGAARELATAGQPQPSTLAFLRVTGTVLDDLDETLAHEHTLERSGVDYHDRFQAWAIRPRAPAHQDADHLPRLDDLLDLQRLLAGDDFAHGPLRQLLTLLGEADMEARERYRRWRQLMGKQRGAALAQFDAALHALGVTATDAALPYVQRADKDGRNQWDSPVGDAIALNAVGSRVSGMESREQEEAAA